MKEKGSIGIEAVSLYCPTCKKAVPVRKRLLLVLPGENLYEYLCRYCSTSVGEKREPPAKEIKILVSP
jgi:hypothetical protein